MKTINVNSLEIFKTNNYLSTSIGKVSDNAYLSIIATNNCQCKCAYCINSETDHRLNLPVDKAITNIKKLINKYSVKEAIILGGEPLLHPNIIELVKRLRNETGLQMIRLTTNGIKLISNKEFIKQLFDKDNGLQGINISCHNEDFMSYEKLHEICCNIKEVNPNIKIRINSNIWKGNLDTLDKILYHISIISKFSDEMRISNVIPKDDFSVNSVNKGLDMILPDEEYKKIFTNLIDHYSTHLTPIENEKTLGFVRYILIPAKFPIIVNWNIGSTVSEQVCENNIKNREINTFKCLVNGEISLSWNEHNIINL